MEHNFICNIVQHCINQQIIYIKIYSSSSMLHIRDQKLRISKYISFHILQII